MPNPPLVRLTPRAAPSSLTRETSPCAGANDAIRHGIFLGGGGQILSFRIYNMPIVSISSRLRLLGADCVRSTPEPAEAHSETRQHTTARSTQYSRAKQSSVLQQQRRTATPPAASTNTSPTPNTQGGGQTHHTGTSPTHSHRRPQTRHARGASPRAHNPTPQRQHGAHHTHNNQGHTYTQHRRDASVMHSREPSPSRPHREEKATQT